MPTFPSISYPSPSSFNPAPNPAGFAADAASAYAAGIHFAQALKQFNYQQALQAQKDAQAQAIAASNQQARIMQGGGTVLDGGGQKTAPTAVPGHTNALGQSGLQVRPGATAADPTDQAGNRVTQQPGGPPLTAEGQAAAEQGQNAVALGGLNQALQGAGYEGVPQPPPPPDDLSTHAGHIFTGLGGVRYHIPSQQEAAQAKEAGKRAGEPNITFGNMDPGKVKDALVGLGIKGATVSDAVSLMNALDKWNQKPAAKHVVTDPRYSGPMVIDPNTNTATSVPLPADRTVSEKPTKYTYGSHTDDAGRVSVTRVSDDEGPQIWRGGKWVPAGDTEAIGPKRKDPDAPKAEKHATPTQLIGIRNKMARDLKAAEREYKKAMQDPVTASDPEATSRALETLNQAKQDAQDSYEESLTQYGYPVEHFEYSDQSKNAKPKAPLPAPAQKSAAVPAAAPTPQKTAAPPPPAPQPKPAPPPAPAAEAKPLAPWNRLATAPPVPQSAGGQRIRVRIGNKTGTIDPREFNPATMQRIQ